MPTIQRLLFLLAWAFASTIPATCFSQDVWIGLVDESGRKSKDTRILTDSMGVYVDAQLTEWHSDGFIGASQDSMRWISEDSVQVYLYKGAQFQWGSFNWKLGSERFGLGRTPKQGDILNPYGLQTDINRVLETLDANGHPFARITSEASTTQEQISLELSVDPGPEILVDSVILRSESLTRSELIARVLGLRKGRLYNGKMLGKSNLVLNGTGYLSATRPLQTLFTKKGAYIYVYAEKKKASSANGILGFQPAPDGSITFTGQADLVLRNTLERGEQFEMHWRRLQAETQQFEISASWPYILGSAIGISSELELYRQDTTFANLFFRNGITFPLNYLTQVSLFTESRRSSSLESLANDSLSNLRSRLYGAGLQSNLTDNPFNPTRGTFLDFSASFGRKTILAQEEGIKDRDLNQFMLQADLGGFLKLAPRWVLSLRNQWGLMGASENQIFFNELFLVGGINSIRGFNEGGLRSSLHGILNSEIRFILDDNSHLLLLADGAILQQETVSDKFNQNALGIGAGIRFATQGGQFSLIYALGKTTDLPFQFATGKVHFGFVSYF